MSPKRWWVEAALNTSTGAAPASPVPLSSVGRRLCPKGAHLKAREGKIPLGRLFWCCFHESCCGSWVAEPQEVPRLCCPAAQQRAYPFPAPAPQPVLPLRGGHGGLQAANRWLQAGYEGNRSFNCRCFVSEPINFTEAYRRVLSAGLCRSRWTRHWREHLQDWGVAEQAALVSETKCSFHLSKRRLLVKAITVFNWKYFKLSLYGDEQE